MAVGAYTPPPRRNRGTTKMAAHRGRFPEFVGRVPYRSAGESETIVGFCVPEVNLALGGRSAFVLFHQGSDVFVGVLPYLLLEVLHPFILVTATRASTHGLCR